MITVNLSQDINTENKYISNTLLQEIKKSIHEKKKIILYLNKRGSHSSLICENCQYLYQCNHCDVSLHVHSYNHKLMCHICSTEYDLPKICSQCGIAKLREIGIGTQQVESYIKLKFPQSQIFRFDTDVIKNKGEKELALKNLEQADIIIGTKMITTGFDFKNIGVIGIILLEQELQIPSYNTKEKLYCNMRQLIGRGIRNGNRAEIIVQTFLPDNPIIQTLIHKNYKDFFIETLHERKLFGYPPFQEMITLEFRDTSQTTAFNYIQKLKTKLDQISDGNIQILLNTKAIKKHNSYHYRLILKGTHIRKFLQNISHEILKNKHLIVLFE